MQNMFWESMNDSEWFEGGESQNAENKKMKRREIKKVQSSTEDLKRTLGVYCDKSEFATK